MAMLVSFPMCSLHLSTTTTTATRLLGTHKGAAKLEVIRRREKHAEGQGRMKKKKKLIFKATLSRTTNTPTQHKDSNTLPQSQVGGGGERRERGRGGGEREERGELVVNNEVGGGGERRKRGGEREERGGELEQEENTLPQSEVGTRGERGELVGVIKPSPSPSYGLLSAILDGLERAIVSAFCGSTPEPLHFISSPNFGPTTETPPHTQLPISGHLPDCLNGEFALIGSNPKHEPVAGYHWFDGDGMIHGLRIKDGNATYVSRYVQTSRLLQEEYFGGAKFIKIGDSKGIFGMLMTLIMICRDKFKVLDTSEGSGTANTGIMYHNGRLLALHEGDKPYAIKILEGGDLETLGYLDFQKQLNHPFTAHPKVDPITGEMFMFGYQLEKPYCLYHVVSKEGEMQDAVPITIPGPIMMHDFGITENYAIFMDLPLCYSPETMWKGNLILSFDSSKKSRFGILPRYAKDDSQIKWFEVPTCYIFHNANAWEEGDEVVLCSCMVPNADLQFFSTPLNKDVKSFKAELYELRFNLKTGHASTKQLSVSSVDFPRINDKYIGRKQRYVYGTIAENIKMKGIAKFDLNSAPYLDGKREIESGGNVAGVFSFGPGRYGSEAVFVPKSSGADESEDDGYLICFVYDENTRKSEALVIDAKTMAPEPIAVVSLPSRLPYGFHATFISEEQLQKKEA